MTNSINSSLSRPYVPAPTQAQIDQLIFLNKPENQQLLVKFVQEQRAGQNPTLPKPDSTLDEIPYSFTMTRTLTDAQRNQLIICLNSQFFSFVILGPTDTGPFVVHLIKITFVAPNYSFYNGWWLNPANNTIQFTGFYEVYTWGIQC
ncbi:hypothetical protein C6344_04155 [Bacillus sp. GBSW19]|uniref:hypothetical protein n=1 Tax=Bacillus TaxID=1386 RepID=UPI000D02A848|nr:MULTISPECIES: hypothetical protein [Bacillus]PRS61100.1 hypothetical protein C6344_04155 [Bacillus sp. GBSW19]QLI78218.1 hypothetical protein HZ310_10530 [Bacillus pumilus]